jgi:hypothetical protein
LNLLAPAAATWSSTKETQNFFKLRIMPKRGHDIDLELGDPAIVPEQMFQLFGHGPYFPVPVGRASAAVQTARGKVR